MYQIYLNILFSSILNICPEVSGMALAHGPMRGGQELGQETRKLDRNPDINIHYFRPTDLLYTPSDAQSRKESASID